MSLIDLYPLTRIAPDDASHRRGDPTSPRKRGEVKRPPTRTAHGLLLRSVPDRSRQRGVAVSGRVGAVDHLRRDADREFRPWRLLHARRLCRVHADRALLRRAWLLG